MSRRAQQYNPWIQLTGRGAVVLMLAVFTLGLLGASWLRWPVLIGGAFLLGSAAAARYTKPGDLLTVAATPPLLFCAALVGVKAATATGNTALSIAEGTAITLARVAPWLLAGTALNLIIALSRGLPQCFRDLRQDLRPGHRRAGPGASPGDDSAARDTSSRYR